MAQEQQLAEMILQVGSRGLSRIELAVKIEEVLKLYGDSRYTVGYNDGVSDGRNRK